MENEATSFWAEIKKYEDTLARDPASYCFAPLAEVYRKVGLLDDAINVAKKGCEVHPEYVGGYMALGRAYLEKGLKDEGRQALEKVVGITPDNLLALKLLGKLYVEEEERAAAEKVFLLILEQAPEDSESLTMLETIRKTMPKNGLEESGNSEDQIQCNDGIFIPVEEPLEENEEDLEEAEIVEDWELSETPGDDVFNDKDVFISTVEPDDISGPREAVSGSSNAHLTVTMAELYLSQGFTDKARAIYHEMLQDDPDNYNLKNRLASLDYAPEHESFCREATSASDGSLLVKDEVKDKDYSFLSEEDARVVGTLEKWLDTIKRRQ